MAENNNIKVQKDLHFSLKELGLFESEANLYTTSLTLGPVTIVSLAEHLGISRPNVYKAITGLEKHGLAKYSDRKRYTRTFVVEPPTVVLEKLRQKRESMADLDQTLVSLMPDLLAHYHQGETPTKIKIFQGRDQWVKIFFQVLEESKSNIKYFGSADAFIELISWDTELQWIKERTTKGIHIDCLLTPGKDAETLKSTDAEGMRTTRFFKGSLPFITGFMLYANKVIVWQPKAPLVVLIEDEYIVQMLRSIYDQLWQNSE